MRNLLIVEDDPGLREQLKWAFCEAFDVMESDSLETTLQRFRESEGPTLVCLDMGLEGKPDKGLEIIDALLGIDRACKIVAVTASTDESLGRESIRRGAFDYLRKPADPDALRVLFDRALRIRELEEEPSWKPASPAPGGSAPDGHETAMIGESEAMKRVFGVLRRLAPAEVDVLISGESGTGKELCARILHRQGARREGPFVSVNLAAIPEHAQEAELFGTTAPGEEKAGLLESADRGTLFLDGIGEMSASLQASLLRFLKERRIRREGDSRGRVLDVRVVAGLRKPQSGTQEASPSAVRAEAGGPKPESGGARLDARSELYRRLAEFEIAMPPLRERGRDALLIAHTLVERNRPRFSQPRLRLSSRAEKLILSHAWPGNVRELENCINRASLSCRNQVIEEPDLQVGDAGGAIFNYREQRRLFERNLLLNALRRTGGNVSLAARTMGVTRPTFYDMMKKSGVTLRVESKV